jgi:hypothetical protein
MFKHCKCLFAFVALFAFAIAELTGVEAHRVLTGLEQGDWAWEYAFESGADEETTEDVPAASGGSDDRQDLKAPGGLKTNTLAAIYPGHFAAIRRYFAAAAACATQTNARALKRVRPPLFILYCRISGALPRITR